MPSWDDVLKEIQDEAYKQNRAQNQPDKDPFYNVRQKYIRQLAKKRGRNIIAYYSSWLQQQPVLAQSVINDDDKNHFMSAVHGLDRKKGLDLLLHTPGGEMSATESLVEYLKQMFEGDIEVFVPQIAMSAGTMMACASKCIHMGKQSSLGPIDPQMRGFPASAILEEFKRAAEEIEQQPWKIPLWQTIVSQYPAGFILSCERAIEMSQDMVGKWLIAGMLSEDDAREKKAKKIVDFLSDHSERKMHSRHIGLQTAQKIGLKIKPLEEDDDLQDLVLTIHHTYMHTLTNTSIVKVVENNQGTIQRIVVNFSAPDQ